jgi:squalene-associated FAD-dependent desaturase
VDRDADQLAHEVSTQRLCIVGGGWAGIAAAVEATRRGCAVTLVEMAPQLGGRARCVEIDGLPLDNGQHILIGAYSETLRLMRLVGVDVDAALDRRPLELVYPDGGGLVLPPGSPILAFVRGVLRAPGWAWSDRLQLLGRAAHWAAMRFRCDERLTVAEFTATLSQRLRDELIDPLCVAALNTPAVQASAAVFLRILRDALFSGPGSADLLLPRRSLSLLLPLPAHEWLAAHGTDLRLATRIRGLERDGVSWRVDGEHFNAVVLACSAKEAARLSRIVAPRWSAQADAFEYEPIVTVYLRSPGSRLPRPMTALRSGPDAPAQFLFDHGQLGGSSGLFAAVASGARAWVDRGADETADAVRRQLLGCLASAWQTPPTVLRTLTERRATFLCTPALQRPSPTIAPGLTAAGDFVDGPYPATLEGAVRSGLSAVAGLEYRHTDSLFAMQKDPKTPTIAS